MMKISASTLALMMLASPTAEAARGAKSAKMAKGSAVLVEEPTCECLAPTIRTATTDTFGNPIKTVAQAVLATPPNCVLTAPSLEMLMVAPLTATLAIVPVVKDPALLATCLEETTASGDLGPTGCSEGWKYLDGTAFEAPVETMAGQADVWRHARPVFPTVGMSSTGEYQNFDLTLTTLTYEAYYSCCNIDEDSCIAYTEPATMAPTPAPTKGKNSRRRL